MRATKCGRLHGTLHSAVGRGRTLMPAITNALATDELRGRYNAMASMVWGISGIVGRPWLAH